MNNNHTLKTVKGTHKEATSKNLLCHGLLWHLWCLAIHSLNIC